MELLATINLEIGKRYECVEYDLLDEPTNMDLREFLATSVNFGYSFTVEKKDEKGVYFYPFADSDEMILLSNDIFAYFEESEI